MAARAQTKRKTRRAGPLSASTNRSSPLPGAPIEQSIPIEVVGELSDEGITALAALLLSIAEQGGAERIVLPTGPSGAPARDDGRRELAQK